jgi:DNA-directed RNA polymerase subunit omega
MLYPSINTIRTKADSRYTLVILAAKRARDIIDGMPKLTEEEVSKPVSIAANEIAEDLITYREASEPEAEPETEIEA